MARRAPFAWPALLHFLAVRAVPGVEEVVDGVYRRSLRLPHGLAIVELADDGEAVRCTFALADPRDLGPGVARRRRLLGLDADPVAVAATLGRDAMLADLVCAVPSGRCSGRRSRWPPRGPSRPAWWTPMARCMRLRRAA